MFRSCSDRRVIDFVAAYHRFRIRIFPFHLTGRPSPARRRYAANDEADH